MKRYAWLAALLILALGATWGAGRDSVALKVSVYAPNPPMAGNAAGTSLSFGADIALPIGGSNSRIVDIDGRWVRVKVSAEAIE